MGVLVGFVARRRVWLGKSGAIGADRGPARGYLCWPSGARNGWSRTKPPEGPPPVVGADHPRAHQGAAGPAGPSLAAMDPLLQVLQLLAVADVLVLGLTSICCLSVVVVTVVFLSGQGDDVEASLKKVPWPLQGQVQQLSLKERKNTQTIPNPN